MLHANGNSPRWHLSARIYGRKVIHSMGGRESWITLCGIDLCDRCFDELVVVATCKRCCLLLSLISVPF